jgi:CubicO group peptidase (beta-lactamase class C family)
MRALLAALLLASAAGGLPAAPAAAADPHALALAAGYKAAFLCSGIFNAGQSEAQVTADDLNGVYPEVQPLLADLPAVVDRDAHSVSVKFDAALPPRIAVWRPLLGCAQLPEGGTNADVVPRLTPDFQRPDLAAMDAAPWPLGDRDAVAKLPRRSARALDAVIADAFTTKFGGRNGDAPSSTAVIILKNGRIVAERYRAGYDLHTPQRTWSVAKSLTATLVGRAAHLGRIDVAAPAPIPEWQRPGDPRAAITTAQLLQMNSGLWTAGAGNRTDEVYLGGASVAQTAAAMPIERTPGSHFNYSNNDIMLAAYAMETRLGAEALGFPFTQLLWPLGMTRTTPETDWQGHFILSSQVWTTARDLARLALLYQNDGMANGQRLLPPGWRDYVSTPHGAQPLPATPGRGGYGAGFWLFGARDGLPDGSYAMVGNRGQYAIIVPSRQLVIVRRGFDAGGAAFDPLAFAKAVLGAVE